MTFELPQNTRQIHGGTEGSHVDQIFQMSAIPHVFGQQL